MIWVFVAILGLCVGVVCLVLRWDDAVASSNRPLEPYEKE